MTNDRITFYVLLTIFIILGIVALKWRQHVIVKRYIEQANRENLEMQEFLIAKLDATRQLLANTDISIDDLQYKATAIIAEMESRNIKGDLNDLIADERDHLASEIRKRQSV